MINVISFKTEWLISKIHIYYIAKTKKIKIKSTQKACPRCISLNGLHFGQAKGLVTPWGFEI